MKKVILVGLVALAVSGCSAIKRLAYDNEIKYSEQAIEKELPKAVEKGNLTQRQSDEIEKVLNKVIERAEGKLEDLDKDAD